MTSTLIGNSKVQVNACMHLGVPMMSLDINFWQSHLQLLANLVLYFFLSDAKLPSSVCQFE